jgi:predicted transcriptional regulator
VKGLASETRVRILQLLAESRLNVNQIADTLSLPQSTVALNVAVLEQSGLIHTEAAHAKRGSQKLCSKIYDEFVIRFDAQAREAEDLIEVEMPVGLFTEFDVSPPCGLCTAEKIVGFLDDPSYFLDPERVKAGLVWFERGFVEYKFPNNLLNTNRRPRRLEVEMELSSEVPATDERWPSDISVWINGIELGCWTAPGDFGKRRGKHTPAWRPLNSSQYGLLKSWSVDEGGSWIDGVSLSDVALADLCLMDHHSIRVRIGIDEQAEHVGGVNIFGRGFGNYDQDLVLRLLL